MTLKQVRETSADFYLHKLAEQILYAAASQHFVVEGQDVLGRIDENADTPPKYGIRGIPTLMLFKGGAVEATKVGALSKSQLTAFIDSNI